jgi:hypothetical protein
LPLLGVQFRTQIFRYFIGAKWSAPPHLAMGGIVHPDGRCRPDEVNVLLSCFDRQTSMSHGFLARTRDCGGGGDQKKVLPCHRIRADNRIIYGNQVGFGGRARRENDGSGYRYLDGTSMTGRDG